MNIFFFILLILAVPPGTSAAATDLQKLVDTELAFAKKAADTNTRQAFLDFTADEGVIFNPTVTNAKAFWQNRAVSSAWLAWYPTWADVSTDGRAGWDTGPWEYHPKGKDGPAAAFGNFATFWLKQADGSFKFVVDMGIGYEKSGFAEKEVKFPADAGKGSKPGTDIPHSDLIEKLFFTHGMTATYRQVLAEDSILLMDGKAPFRGKKDILAEFIRQQDAFDRKDSIAVDVKARRAYDNLSYIYGEFTLTKAKDNSVHKQNFFQVWKHRDKKWQLVLEVFNDIPNKT